MLLYIRSFPKLDNLEIFHRFCQLNSFMYQKIIQMHIFFMRSTQLQIEKLLIAFNVYLKYFNLINT